jgi:hypothetical protein
MEKELLNAFAVTVLITSAALHRQLHFFIMDSSVSSIRILWYVFDFFSLIELDYIFAGTPKKCSTSVQLDEVSESIFFRSVMARLLHSSF